jgi:hypothetical protein
MVSKLKMGLLLQGATHQDLTEEISLKRKVKNLEEVRQNLEFTVLTDQNLLKVLPDLLDLLPEWVAIMEEVKPLDLQGLLLEWEVKVVEAKSEVIQTIHQGVDQNLQVQLERSEVALLAHGTVVVRDPHQVASIAVGLLGHPAEVMILALAEAVLLVGLQAHLEVVEEDQAAADLEEAAINLL